MDTFNNLSFNQLRQAPPYYEWGNPSTPEELSLLFSQVRAILAENRVIFHTSGKAIRGCLQVLQANPVALAPVPDDALPISKNKLEEASTPTGGVDLVAQRVEARTFANECVARVVGILLDQQSQRVELRYQEIISQTLVESIALARCMMSHSDTRSAGIDVVLHVLDSTKNYYVGNSLATSYYTVGRSVGTGLKHVLDSCVRAACHTGTLASFAQYLMAESEAALGKKNGTSGTGSNTAAQKEGKEESTAVTAVATAMTAATTATTSATTETGEDETFGWWRGGTQLLALFQVVCDVLATKGATDMLAAALLPSLLRWGTNCFLSIPSKMLKKEDTDTVAQILRKCEDATTACLLRRRTVVAAAAAAAAAGVNPESDADSDPGATNTGGSGGSGGAGELDEHFAFRFWLSVTSQYLRTGGLPQRLFALDQVNNSTAQ